MVLARSCRGYTLVELAVVCALVAILAVAGVRGFVRAHATATVVDAASRFTFVLRQAQATAWSSRQPVRVRVVDDGSAYVVESVAGDSPRPLARGAFGGARCATNYPGLVVEFGPQGFPRVPGGAARAGTFTLTCAGSSRRVVVQMGGVVRCL